MMRYISALLNHLIYRFLQQKSRVPSIKDCKGIKHLSECKAGGGNIIFCDMCKPPKKADLNNNVLNKPHRTFTSCNDGME